MDYKFQRTRIDKISREKIIGEIEKVAEVFKYIEFGKRDFAKLGNISATTVENEFGVRLHIDHKIPFSKGGGSTLDNLQTLCQDCNLGKSDEVYNK